MTHPTFTGPDGLKIQFSSEASARYDGELRSAFQENTYLARISTPDQRAMVVILPRGAAIHRPETYVNDLIRVGQRCLAAGTFNGHVLAL